jgi:peptidoglycan/xylan/chitin deacetylase (PgdA/CDA1 family)/uncharacterized protein YceK
MRNLIIFALIVTVLLSGCSLKESTVKLNKQKQPIAHGTMKNTHLLKPQATISITPLTFDSTNATISTIDRKENVSEITYHIWRTADGKASMKAFSSKDRDRDFSFLLDTKDFMSQRGEFNVEAYSVHKNGKKEFLAQSKLTFQQHVPILMYHAIDDYKGNGTKELFVTPANFEAQMRYLEDNGYTFLTFERWDEINKVNKPVLVTFDDGMKNNLNAFNILLKLKNDKFKPVATEFMIAGCIDAGTNWLSSSDLKEMVKSGIYSVQSHTMTHNDLPKVTDYEKELNTSKEQIEQVTGKPIIALAYPSGHFNDKVVEETKKYYKYAVTTKPGQSIEKGELNEMLLLHRVRISYSTTINQFSSMLKVE